MAASCPRCAARGKTWKGSDPKCAFLLGVFMTENWDCETMNELRRIARDHFEEQTTHNEDTYAVAIPWDFGRFVLLCWYKRRGRTGTALVVDDNGLAEPLRLEVAEEVIARYPFVVDAEVVR